MDSNAIIPENCQTRDVGIETIKVLKRIRKNALEIGALAEDIRWHGLINPPTVLDNGDNTYTLITGLRRLRACQRLEMSTIRVTILTALEADDMLALEYAENEQRQDFTVAERLEYAEKIKEIERRRGRERMGFVHRADQRADNAQPNPEAMDYGPYHETGTTRDIIAQKVGFSSGRQYERVAKIADARPELLDKIDSGEMSVRQAYNEAFAAPASPSPKQELPSAAEGQIKTAPASASSTNTIPFPNQRNDDVTRSELDAQAAADTRAYNLTKAYNNTICAVMQLETTPEAVREWIRFSRMTRDEIQGTLTDISVAIEHLEKLGETLSSCLSPQRLK